MISLCKCCFLLEKHEHNSQSHSGGSIGSCSASEAAATSINKIKQDTSASTKAKITRPSDLGVLKSTQDKANSDEEGDKVALLVTDQDSAILENNAGLGIVQEQPGSSKSLLRKLSEDHSHFEEDSGTCVDHSNSSEIMLDNLVDKVQLTVSSVNSILPDLPEQDDDCEEKPLLPILPTGPIGLQQLPSPNSNINQKPSCIPMVVLAASKRQHRSPSVVQKNNDHVTNTTNYNGTGNGNTNGGGSSVGSSHHSSTESVKPSVLKKPKPPYSRQCSAPSTACSSLTPPTGSEGSSRRDSGAEFDKFSSSATSASSTVQVRKNREKSPCVSFDTDIRYHVPEVSESPAGTSGSGGGAMRARSRSDASSRFKGKIAWLRDRRDLLRSSTIAEDRESVTKSNNAVSITPASAHRPRTRSDTRWIKINRKKALENTPTEAKKAFEWPMASNFSRRWRKQKKVSEDNTVASKVPKDLERSQSVAGLTNHEVEKTISSKLKRHGSERGQTAKKSVAFETGNNSWWNASMKLLFDMTGGKSNKSKTRRRHMSSDARNVLLLNTAINSTIIEF